MSAPPFRILLVSYSQTGQLSRLAGHFIAPCEGADNIEIEQLALKPQQPFPFPWRFGRFFDTFPETVRLQPQPIETPEFRHERYDLVVLAGFMRILMPEFCAHYEGRCINIHPSLLPAFTGLHTHRRAIEEGCRVAGCTIHFVTAELDNGPIIAQGVVPILDGDTEKALAERVLSVEHVLFPQAVAEGMRAGSTAVLSAGAAASYAGIAPVEPRL